MRAPYQTDSTLLPKIKKYGCAMLSCCFLSNKEWSVAQVNGLYQIAKDAAAIDEDCTITWKLFLPLVGGLEFVKFETPAYKCKEGEVELQRWYYSETGYHFVVGDGKDRVLWDPWPSSKTVCLGKMVDKRILRRV